MKKGVVIGIILVLLAAGVFCGGLKVGAASAGAGSVSDPLITKSYLESRLNDITGGTASFCAVEIAKGKFFYASEGTEFFLYSGSGTVTGTDGLVDLTTGELFSNGNIMVKYHLFISPGENNGIKISSAAVLYVKGSYLVK